MEDDLSLSQTLGGLRIVNPDNESSPTSSTEATLSTTRPTSINTAETDHTSLSQRASPLSLSFLYRGESPTDFSTSKSSSNYDRQFMNQCSNHSSRESLILQKKDQGSKNKTDMNKDNRNSVPSDEFSPQDAQLLLHDSIDKNFRKEQFHDRLSRPTSDNASGQLSSNPLLAVDSNLSRFGVDPSRSSLLLASSSSCTDSPRSTASEIESVSRKAIGSEQSRQKNPSHAVNDYGNPRPSFRRAVGLYSEIRPGYINEPTFRHDTEANIVPSCEDWKDKGAAVGIREEYDSNGNLVLRQVKKGVRDFVFGHLLGEGSYSQVVLGTDRQTLKEYAVKVLDKKHIIKEKKVKYVNIEKDTLNRLIEHPGIVRLYYTFQDSASLYYVLDIASGGELLGVLKKVGSFDEECTRFYGAQILDAIEHMHKRGVIHRDLKPENVLMDDKMHVKITDFGTAKLLPDPRKLKDKSGSYDFVDDEEDESSRAKSFVGTAEYVSPELLTEKNACKASDLWAFGCIIYQLLTGRPPFKASNDYQTFQKIVNLEYEYPPGFPRQVKDLIDRLLVLDPQKRLSIEHIKSHPFFEGIQWGRDLWKQKAPRLKPYVPQPQEPNIIKLSSGYPNIHGNAKCKRGSKISSPNVTSRPHPTVITELPPPTQLDIEWSPVLTRNNERILKLGNLNVYTNPISHSSSTRNADNGDNHEKKRLSRFFGGISSKKRQRLVIVTSSARIVLVAAGGEEKKLKTEISLLGSECSWQVQSDAKGQEIWCVYNNGTQYTFEDSKNAVVTGDASKSSAQQWIESIERAKEIATSQSMINSFNNEIGFDVIPTMSSPKSARFSGINYRESININDRSSRSCLKKGLTNSGGEETENYGKRSRFGKRQSKSGLSIPF